MLALIAKNAATIISTATAPTIVQLMMATLSTHSGTSPPRANCVPAVRMLVLELGHGTVPPGLR